MYDIMHNIMYGNCKEIDTLRQKTILLTQTILNSPDKNASDNEVIVPLWVK